jgi:F-box protein 33
MGVLEYMSACYAQTLRSIMWVDSLSHSKESWSFLTSHYDSTPDPLIMISWLCKKLEELVFYGYKYCEENLIAIARLRGDKLKKFEIAEDDILLSNADGHQSSENFLIVSTGLSRCFLISA